MPHLSHIPAAPVGNYPTPLEALKAVSKLVNGPRIWVKRDDLTGVAMGGSKTRSLSTLLGDALAKGADTVITCGPVTSNHVRLTTAAANRLGLDVVLVLKRPQAGAGADESPQGNMLLNHVLGAEIIYVETDTLAGLDPAMQDVAARLVVQGRRPYIIPGGGYSPIGALGYLGLVQELLEQAQRANITIDGVICASGSGCIQSGLILGNLFYGSALPIIGITINRGVAELKERISHDVAKAASLAGVRGEVATKDICVLDDFIGDGYAIPSQAGMAAMRLLAEEEGLLLDPCYTAKSMAGVLSLAATRFKAGQNIVFIHTGGSPGIFSYAQDIARRLSAPPPSQRSAA